MKPNNFGRVPTGVGGDGSGGGTGASAGGDLGGTFPGPTVTGFDGIPFGDPGGEVDGSVPVYNAGTGEWDWELPAGGLTPADVLALLGPQHVHVNNVTFSGDASTTAFILPAAPVDAYGVSVFVAGTRSQDWTLSGVLLDTLTFGAAPAAGTDNIVVDIAAAI